MKFVDVDDDNVDDDHDSMIIVVEPESGGPEFIMFDPNQDKLPELINSQKNKEKMSAQHIMYKSILERLQQEEKDKDTS